MLKTDGYAFLNIDDPACAWCAYRGALISAAIHGPNRGFVSVWSAGLLRSSDPARLSRELVLEGVRADRFNRRVSRLAGMYCFLDAESAKRAASLWGSARPNHFRFQNLVEISLEGGSQRDRLDSNWITYAPRDENGFYLLDDLDWVDAYWSGEPFPRANPIWETIFDGRMYVLGTELRTLAYHKIKRQFPDSLGILEVARQAAWIGSNLGDICVWLADKGDSFAAHYLMNWKDADTAEFNAKIEELHRSGESVNWGDIAPHLRNGTFGKVPDFRPFEFSRPKQVLLNASDTARGSEVALTIEHRHD
jgi:hypothetical protein